MQACNKTKEQIVTSNPLDGSPFKDAGKRPPSHPLAMTRRVRERERNPQPSLGRWQSTHRIIIVMDDRRQETGRDSTGRVIMTREISNRLWNPPCLSAAHHPNARRRNQRRLPVSLPQNRPVILPIPYPGSKSNQKTSLPTPSPVVLLHTCHALLLMAGPSLRTSACLPNAGTVSAKSLRHSLDARVAFGCSM